MAKEVTLEVQIDEKGEIHVVPKGTQGSECLNLMSFLDKVKGLCVLETTHNDDMKEKKVQQVGQQKIG
jgi:hypothetical protein